MNKQLLDDNLSTLELKYNLAIRAQISPTSSALDDNLAGERRILLRELLVDPAVVRDRGTCVRLRAQHRGGEIDGRD